MFKKVAIVGPDKAFFSDVKENIFRINDQKCWLEFDNGYEIITYCLNNKELPDIVFVEMLPFKIDGIIVTDYLKTYLPEICVVCVFTELQGNIIRDVADVGAVGLMTKSDAAMLFKIVKSDSNGCGILKTSVNDIASIQATLHLEYFKYRDETFKKCGITKREALFLFLNSTGLEYGEIAALMFISRKTVDNLFNSVAKKVGVQDRHNLTLFCIRMGLTRFLNLKPVLSKT
nr:LuxR C-terminal-related transcriptional regulator [uncultured Sediminibacterium sp.]